MSNRAADVNREIVLNDYNSAKLNNEELYQNHDVRASSEYIYPNQMEDAFNICNILYYKRVRAVSIIKRTKVGMDGLMIEIAKNMSTHSDNEFVLDRKNIIIATGMSNRSWEDDMKEKIPSCFRNNVFHHGKLQKLKTKLTNLKNAVIILDEIDSGDKEDQKLHKLLKDRGILDIEYMEKNNIYFIFVSATIVNELKDLYKWGDKHKTYLTTIPSNYISHGDFLEMGIIQEFYPINNEDSSDRWIQEDIIDYYGSESRVHIIRTDQKNTHFIEQSCFKFGINFKNHTSVDRISHEELIQIFDNLTKHLVIAIKGFFRRANLIPNAWKKLIGATHEKYVKKWDTNVQIQGLTGRMTGYWKPDIVNGHKTGPYRTSIASIKEYEDFYKNPLSNTKYTTSGSKKLLTNPRNIRNLEPVEEPKEETNKRVPFIIDNLDENNEIFNPNKKPRIKRKIQIIKNELEKRNKTDILRFINDEKTLCKQISKPQEFDSPSYKKHITDVVNASSNQKEFIIDLKPGDKGSNCWQAFIDKKEYRICIVIWSIDKDLY